MGEWSLFTDFQLKFKDLEKYIATTEYADYSKNFVRGSVWKNFFVKYPESNRIHKRTVDLSKRDCKNDPEFLDYLYQSQCNDCLWHGVFGGLYLPNLRNNAWNAAIDAEKRYEQLANTKFPQWECRDSNLDGYDELYLRTERFNVEFVSRDGGQISTLEWKNPSFNLLNTLSRRKEGYHQIFFEPKPAEVQEEQTDGVATIHDKATVAPEEFKQHLGYDWYNRNSFIDHIVDHFDPQEFIAGTFNERGDFVNQPMELLSTNKGYKFTRNGGVFYHDNTLPAAMDKSYQLDGNRILCDISLKSGVHAWYVQEHNLHVASVADITVNGEKLPNSDDLRLVQLQGREITIKDPYTGATLMWKWDREMSIALFVVNTVSLAVDTMELTAQGLCILAACEWESSLEVKTELTVE
jgi:hypothetical protein